MALNTNGKDHDRVFSVSSCNRRHPLLQSGSVHSGHDRECVRTGLSACLVYILVDGGSTDETLAVLKSYGDRLWRYSEPDRVKAYAVNKGTARATGDWLCFPGADDYWIASTRLAQAASGLKEFGPRYLVNEEKQ